MRTVEDATLDDSLPLERLREEIEARPVELAVLFGSRARGDAHSRSDIDVAVLFDDLEPADRGYNDVFFGLSVSLTDLLETDEVDLVDLRRCEPSLVRSIFEHGILLVGTEDEASDLRETLLSDVQQSRMPRERLESSIDRINAHLGQSAVPATDEYKTNQ